MSRKRLQTARAAQYIRDYRDPCGLGVHVAYVSVIDTRIVEGAQ